MTYRYLQSLCDNYNRQNKELENLWNHSLDFSNHFHFLFQSKTDKDIKVKRRLYKCNKVVIYPQIEKFQRQLYDDSISYEENKEIITSLANEMTSKLYDKLIINHKLDVRLTCWNGFKKIIIYPRNKVRIR